VWKHVIILVREKTLNLLINDISLKSKTILYLIDKKHKKRLTSQNFSDIFLITKRPIVPSLHQIFLTPQTIIFHYVSSSIAPSKNEC